MSKILAVDGMMEPIATSTNTAINIKMSAPPYCLQNCIHGCIRIFA